MKINILVALILLTIQSQAFANQEKTSSGQPAYNVIDAVAQAGVPVFETGDEGANYHVWKVECSFKTAEITKVEEQCILMMGPSENAPSYGLTGRKAARLINTLLKVDAKAIFDGEKFSVNVLNLDGITSVHGAKAYQLSFVDMND